MTREEINNELDRAFEVLVHCGHMDMRRREAFYMAIQALSAEPCEDAISREKALKCFTWSNDKADAWNGIKNLPPVTPQPKMGHWIGHREHCEELGVMPSGLGAYEWCSNCDCGIDVKEWHRNNYNYCPNCGAKMEEGNGWND